MLASRYHDPSPETRGVDVPVWDDREGRWRYWHDRQDPEYIRRVAREEFSERKSPLVWILKELDLFAAARYLQEGRERYKGEPPIGGVPAAFVFPSTYFMLAGMGMELLLKARLLCNVAWPISNTEFRRVASGSHNLVELLQRTHMKNNDLDRDVLGTLGQYIRWDGRYPTPRNTMDMEESWLRNHPDEDSLWTEYLRVRKKFGTRVGRATEEWLRRRR
jgi:hypothetical protein